MKVNQEGKHNFSFEKKPETEDHKNKTGSERLRGKLQIRTKILADLKALIVRNFKTYTINKIKK